jgi:UDP-N-acetylmuramoylalanine--D-glutamate ligase
MVGGVSFVDDSLSTNVLPTLAALDAFPGRRIALIVGGHDRGIDYAPLAAGVVAREAPTYVLTLPDSGPRIRTAIEAIAPATPPAPAAPATPPAPAAPATPSASLAPFVPGFAGVTDCTDLAAAVAAAYRWAQPDGIVLLSPAAPSFGVFKDYRDRAEAFSREVRALI